MIQFLCFSVRRVDRGVCFESVQECNEHDDCDVLSEKCCHQHCCPKNYYQQWQQFPCLSDEYCKNLHLGQFCCLDTNQCCDLNSGANVTSAIAIMEMDDLVESATNSSLEYGTFLEWNYPAKLENTELYLENPESCLKNRNCNLI